MTRTLAAKQISLIGLSFSVGSLCATLNALLPPRLTSPHLANDKLRSLPAARVTTHSGGTAYIFADHCVGTPTWRSPARQILSLLSRQVEVDSTALDLRVLPLTSSLFGESYAFASNKFSSLSMLSCPIGELPVVIRELPFYATMNTSSNTSLLRRQHHFVVLPQPIRVLEPSGWSGSPVREFGLSESRLQGILIAARTKPGVGTALIGVSTVEPTIQQAIDREIHNTPRPVKLIASLIITWERTASIFTIATLGVYVGLCKLVRRATQTH